MRIRLRKLIGAVTLIALVTVWALLAMSLAQSLPSITGFLAVIYYMIMGLGWLLPAMPLVRWMQRPDQVPE